MGNVLYLPNARPYVALPGKSVEAHLIATDDYVDAPNNEPAVSAGIDGPKIDDNDQKEEVDNLISLTYTSD